MPTMTECFQQLTDLSVIKGNRVMVHGARHNLMFISAPEPKAQVHYCDHALSFVRRPSVRPSSLTFHIFDFSSETAEWNLSKLDRKLDLNVLYQVCVFRADRVKLSWIGSLTSQLTIFQSYMWRHIDLQADWRRSWTYRKTRWPSWPLICWDIFDFSSETAKQNSMKLDRKQDLNVLYQVCVFRADRKNKMAALASDWLRHFRLLLWNHWTESNKTWQEARSQRPLPSLCFVRPIGKTRWPPRPLIGWDIFDFYSETAERNSTKLDRKQDLSVLYQVCVFWVDRKNKMAALASDWLRHFRLLLWNRWTEFNETWQEARSQCPLSSLCFLGRSEKQDGRPGLWLAETFSTSSLKPLNGIQRNLTGSKISTSFTKFVFFGPIGKTRWPPWPLIGWDIFDFSSETVERNSTKLYRKQDLNVLYQICIFRANRKNKMAALASDWLRHFQLLLWNNWTELKKKLWTSSIKFVFFGPIRKTRWPPWPLIGWDIFDFSSETVERNSTKLDRKQDLNVLYQVCVFRADRKNKMAALASDWLRHFRLLLWNRWIEF